MKVPQEEMKPLYMGDNIGGNVNGTLEANTYDATMDGYDQLKGFSKHQNEIKASGQELGDHPHSQVFLLEKGFQEEMDTVYMEDNMELNVEEEIEINTYDNSSEDFDQLNGPAKQQNLINEWGHELGEQHNSKATEECMESAGVEVLLLENLPQEAMEAVYMEDNMDMNVEEGILVNTFDNNSDDYDQLNDYFKQQNVINELGHKIYDRQKSNATQLSTKSSGVEVLLVENIPQHAIKATYMEDNMEVNLEGGIVVNTYDNTSDDYDRLNSYFKQQNIINDLGHHQSSQDTQLCTKAGSVEVLLLENLPQEEIDTVYMKDIMEVNGEGELVVNTYENTSDNYDPLSYFSQQNAINDLRNELNGQQLLQDNEIPLDWLNVSSPLFNDSLCVDGDQIPAEVAVVDESQQFREFCLQKLLDSIPQRKFEKIGNFCRESSLNLRKRAAINCLSNYFLNNSLVNLEQQPTALVELGGGHDFGQNTSGQIFESSPMQKKECDSENIVKLSVHSTGIDSPDLGVDKGQNSALEQKSYDHDGVKPSYQTLPETAPKTDTENVSSSQSVKLRNENAVSCLKNYLLGKPLRYDGSVMDFGRGERSEYNLGSSKKNIEIIFGSQIMDRHLFYERLDGSRDIQLPKLSAPLVDAPLFNKSMLSEKRKILTWEDPEFYAGKHLKNRKKVYDKQSRLPQKRHFRYENQRRKTPKKFQRNKEVYQIQEPNQNDGENSEDKSSSHENLNDFQSVTIHELKDSESVGDSNEYVRPGTETVPFDISDVSRSAARYFSKGFAKIPSIQAAVETMISTEIEKFLIKRQVGGSVEKHFVHVTGDSDSET